MAVNVKVLNHTFRITEEEVENSLEVEITGKDCFFMIGDNLIEKDGLHTLMFDSDEDPFEWLYLSLNRVFVENVEFITEEIFEIYHRATGRYIVTGLTKQQAEEIVKNAEYDGLEIYPEMKFISGKIIEKSACFVIADKV